MAGLDRDAGTRSHLGIILVELGLQVSGHLRIRVLRLEHFEEWAHLCVLVH